MPLCYTTLTKAYTQMEISFWWNFHNFRYIHREIFYQNDEIFISVIPVSKYAFIELFLSTQDYCITLHIVQNDKDTWLKTKTERLLFVTINLHWWQIRWLPEALLNITLVPLLKYKEKLCNARTRRAKHQIIMAIDSHTAHWPFPIWGQSLVK